MQETWAGSPGQEDPLEEGMVTHSSVLAWRIPMDRGAWRATVHGVTKTERLSTEALLKLCSNEAVEVNNAEDSCELKYSEF